MPKVRVPRKNVTPGEIVTVLSRRLGPGYQVESNGGRRVMVRKSPLMYASISITDQPGASVFGVHGGGFFFLRLVNTFGTARRVADALRRSPEFRSLLASQPEDGAELSGRRGGSLAAVLVTVEAAGDGREQARAGERVGAVGEQGGRAGHAEPFGLRLARDDAPGHPGMAGQQAVQPGGQQVGAGTPRHLQDLQRHGW
jgi:hypothetical protein